MCYCVVFFSSLRFLLWSFYNLWLNVSYADEMQEREERIVEEVSFVCLFELFWTWVMAWNMQSFTSSIVNVGKNESEEKRELVFKEDGQGKRLFLALKTFPKSVQAVAGYWVFVLLLQSMHRCWECLEMAALKLCALIRQSACVTSVAKWGRRFGWTR